MTNFITVDTLPFPGKETYNFKRPLKRVKADEINIARALRKHVHSWILWKSNKRSGDNFEGYSGITFDIDKLFDKTPNLTDLVRAAECVKYNFPEWKKFYIYPSWSGTGLHIEIPLSVEEEYLQKKSTYETLYKYYIKQLSQVFKGVDDSCKDLARIIYPANPQSYIVLCGKDRSAMDIEDNLLQAISKTLKLPKTSSAKIHQKRFYTSSRTLEDRLDTSKLTTEGSRHINCLKDMVYVANCNYYSPDKKEEIFQKIMDASTLPEREKQSILTSVKAKYLN